MVEEMEFPDDEPQYYFLNLGETHYPYMLSGADMPHISGVHGAIKSLGKDAPASPQKIDEAFNPEQLKMLHKQQVKCVEYIDGLIGKLIEKAPKDTWFIVTSDHGELFGEDGYFGHGPIMHASVSRSRSSRAGSAEGRRWYAAAGFLGVLFPVRLLACATPARRDDADRLRRTAAVRPSPPAPKT